VWTGDKAGINSAEAALAPVLNIAIYWHFRTTNVDEMNSLKG
jgi:hypothetical protein